MKSFRDRTGFTLMELMVVVAVIGIIAVMAFPSMKAYRRKEITRGTATQVSGWFSDARTRAISNGRMTFLLLEEPTNGMFPFEADQFASLVTDANGNRALDETDSAVAIYLPPGAKGQVKLYSPDTVIGAGSPVPSDDMSEGMPSVSLGELTNGTTLPVGVDIGVPAVAFSAQGAPVAVDTPDQWGTGAGGIYLTDDESLVLAVLVMPLGEVKVRAYDPASETWK